MPAGKGCLGILTNERDGSPPFEGARFHRLLAEAGMRRGLFVYVFTPRGVDWIGKRVTGFVYDRATGRWEVRNLPLPDLVYDRFFYSPGRPAPGLRGLARRLREAGGTRFLGIGLPDKYRVYRLLADDGVLRAHLPPHRLAAGPADVGRLLAAWGDVVLKPVDGRQGRGVIRLEPAGAGWRVTGRDRRNGVVRRTFVRRRELDAWLAGFLSRRRHVATPYLHLATRSGAPFDIRVFLQKDGSGRWQWIGMAARVGRPGSLTSNLHGGGTAVDAMRILGGEFGERAGDIAATIRRLAFRAVRLLERRNGRLAEAGLDFGVDPAGSVWFLEANSRPGRAIFARIGDRDAERRAIVNPILYACHLRDRPFGRVT
jgi:hypothetical protein